jgi:RND family efflux transporter MFP subunit
VKKPTLYTIGAVAGVSILLAVWAPFAAPGGVEQGKGPAAGNDPAGPFTVLGRTQCIHTRKAIIAPAVLHPVVEVFVAPGDKVKKGQKLVLLDDDEPKADLRNKEAILASAGIALKEAKRLLASVESIQSRGVIPEQRIHEVRTAALKAEKDESAAEAARDASKAELEHYTIEAAIDGIVNRIDCYPGMVSRPGTTVWGEILDLSELDVVCQLALSQVERAKVGQTGEVLALDGKTAIGAGKIVFIGLQADPKTGAVPVHVRLANAESALRCEVPVSVRFGGALKSKDAK